MIQCVTLPQPFGSPEKPDAWVLPGIPGPWVHAVCAAPLVLATCAALSRQHGGCWGELTVGNQDQHNDHGLDTGTAGQPHSTQRMHSMHSTGMHDQVPMCQQGPYRRHKQLLLCSGVCVAAAPAVAAVRGVRLRGMWCEGPATTHLRKLSPLEAAIMKSTTAAAIRICVGSVGVAQQATAVRHLPLAWATRQPLCTVSLVCACGPELWTYCRSSAASTSLLPPQAVHSCRTMTPTAAAAAAAKHTLTSRSSNCFRISFHSGVPVCSHGGRQRLLGTAGCTRAARCCWQDLTGHALSSHLHHAAARCCHSVCVTAGSRVNRSLLLPR